MESSGVAKSPKFFFGIAVGQFMALIDSTGATLSELAGDHLLPMFMAMGCCFLLFSTHGVYSLIRRGLHLKLVWWKYMLLACVDVSAAYFTIAALRYTSVTSWALIQPFGLLLVVTPLSIYLLKARYNRKHILSAILAIAGLVLLLFSDADGTDEDDKHSSKDMLIGDLCVFLGSSLYGLFTILLEVIVKDQVPHAEILGAVGGFGSIVSCCLALALGEISSGMFESPRIAYYTVGAIVANFSFYSLNPIVLENAGSAALEISLLAVNFWSVLGKLFIIGGFKTNVFGFVFALAMVVTGVTGFALSGDPYAQSDATNGAVQSEETVRLITSDV